MNYSPGGPRGNKQARQVPPPSPKDSGFTPGPSEGCVTVYTGVGLQGWGGSIRGAWGPWRGPPGLSLIPGPMALRERWATVEKGISSAGSVAFPWPLLLPEWLFTFCPPLLSLPSPDNPMKGACVAADFLLLSNNWDVEYHNNRERKKLTGLGSRA